METTQVVPLYSATAGYREWETVLDGQHYCIVHEGSSGWTLLRESGGGKWCDDERTVDEFLTAHNLRLAE